MSDTVATCGLCGEPMPPNETMFKYHGYSGPCPKPPLPNTRMINGDEGDEITALREEVDRWKETASASEKRVASAQAEVERLTAVKTQYQNLYDREAAENAALRAQVGRLTKALAPFANIKADDGDDFSKWPDDVTIKCYVLVREIKAARAELYPAPEERPS